MKRCVLALVSLAAGCGSSGGGGAAAADTLTADTSEVSSGVEEVVGSDDVGEPDPNDAALEDAEVPEDAPVADEDVSIDVEAADDTGAVGAVETPFGPIDGTCGTLLEQELGSAAPSFYVNTWHLQGATLDTSLLRTKAQQRYTGPNAGGSSKCSEVMSMQMLWECEQAATYKLEVEVVYDLEGSLTDWIAEYDGQRLGVSVSRAYLGPNVATYTEADAVKLLEKKLSGINESTLNVSAGDKWTKQLLHIWTRQPEWADTLRSAWEGLDAELKADTIILVSVEDGAGWVVTDACDD